ncbi:DUF2971 domain-containing protein [Bradyrhizobium sp. YCK136]|uniref:DUF2971 domain-containing protein n=1 Tax=Bradyrhizobium TaxID=374 RepID=UPI001B8BDD78|nr:DUF2971 domain-containing protein [Bradyrhizobium diazoefficiens]MBR0868211.1 DUF2971 domain-containing protein [Bradyrhizobium diazoefficiens]MBR0892746.1 DUF2971 domain-containing protein [Bradyrhizobium diazoefficiens]MBR0924423.1 DUF2971 domain-containing protein [Bradyrhizobium diazoefficiens]
MRTVTAAMNRIQFLYNYQRFDAGRLERLLATNSLYLSDTKGFNDPWDCRPCYDLTRLDDPAFYERQVQFFEHVDRKRNTHLSDAEHRERADRLRKDRAFLEYCIYQMSGMESEIQKLYRVYCLTTKPADTLMWSHYAQNHTGICLEFGCANDVLSSALKVVYCETYPPLDLADNDAQTILLPLIAKAKAWEYEDEYRLIAQEEAEALSRESLITKSNLLLLPDGALTSIIIGCVASDAACGAVRDIVRRSGRKIGLKQAERVPNHYSLTIKDVT